MMKDSPSPSPEFMKQFGLAALQVAVEDSCRDNKDTYQGIWAGLVADTSNISGLSDKFLSLLIGNPNHFLPGLQEPEMYTWFGKGLNLSLLFEKRDKVIVLADRYLSEADKYESVAFYMGVMYSSVLKKENLLAELAEVCLAKFRMLIDPNHAKKEQVVIDVLMQTARKEY